MNAAIGILLILILPEKFSDAYAVVTLFTNKSVYFTEGGSIELICELNEDLGSLSVWFERDRLKWIWIRNSSTCELLKLIPWDPCTYSITCNNSRRFVLVRNGMNASDHNTTWRCEIAPYKYGPCSAAKSMCVSEGLPVFVRDVPEIPSNVTVVDVTPTSVTVQWLAGHSGGPEQTFYILASSSDFTRSVYAVDPGYGKVGSVVIEDLTPNTKYHIYIWANNTLSASNMTVAIIVYTPSAKTATEMNLLVGGVTAVVGLIVVAIAAFILKKQWCSHGTCRKQAQQSSQRIELSADMGRGRTNPARRNEVISEHKSLQVVKSNAATYLEVFDITSDDICRVNISEGVDYEKLHMYGNSHDKNYSFMTRPHKE